MLNGYAYSVLCQDRELVKEERNAGSLEKRMEEKWGEKSENTFTLILIY